VALDDQRRRDADRVPVRILGQDAALAQRIAVAARAAGFWPRPRTSRITLLRSPASCSRK
jgi:hypothetical protein